MVVRVSHKNDCIGSNPIIATNFKTKYKEGILKKSKRKKRKIKRNLPKRNYHHIINKVHGGNNHKSNLLFIRVDRHIALHHLFGNLSLEAIIYALAEQGLKIALKEKPTLKSWLTLFEDKSKHEAMALLYRVIRAKDHQKQNKKSQDNFLSHD